jgi:hypothetical protein
MKGKPGDTQKCTARKGQRKQGGQNWIARKGRQDSQNAVTRT